jgi:hypothetical protein
VHEHVWRTVCSVCATGARVAQFSMKHGGRNVLSQKRTVSSSSKDIFIQDPR